MDIIALTFSYFSDIVLLVIGIIFCFFGYKSFKASITCAGLILGFEFGGFLCRWIGIYTGKPLDLTIVIAVEVLFAIVFGALAFKFYKKAIVVVTTFLVGTRIYRIIATGHPEKTAQLKDSLILLGICLVIGLAFGLLCLFLQKWMVIILTSIGGANILSGLIARYLIKVSIVSEIAQFSVSKIFNASIATNTAIAGLLFIILCLLGILAQKKNAK